MSNDAGRRAAPRASSDHRVDRQRNPAGASREGGDPHDVRHGELGEAFHLAFAEFLGGALLTTGAVLLAGALGYVVDRTEPAALGTGRRLLENFFNNSSSVGQLLQSIASTVITVASITFSLLLVAIQQSASSFTSQTFDQFLRRRANQFYMGFFVGVGVYAQLQAASVHKGFVPVYGAALAVLLTVCAVGLLLVLVYNAVNQMRPVVIVEAIHDHLVEARTRQLDRIVRRTRRSPTLSNAYTAPVWSTRTGFVLEIDLDRIQKAVESVASTCEVVLDVSIGRFVAYGDRIAEVRTKDGAGAARVSAGVKKALRIARQRNIDSVDAAFGLEQLETVGWTSISGAKHNPQAARIVIAQLRDVLARFSMDCVESDEADTSVVYRDDVPEILMRTIESLAVITADSQQHQAAADILDAIAGLFPTLPAQYRDRATQVLMRTLPALASHPPTLPLEAAMERSRQALAEVGEDDALSMIEHGLNNLRDRVGAVDSQYTPR